MNENNNAHLDDPRLTAYALDQLPDDERAEIESWLEKSPAARDAVEEIRRVSAFLRKAKLAEPSSAASEDLRLAVAAKLDAEPVGAKPVAAASIATGHSRSSVFAIAISLALLLAVAIGIWGAQRSWQTEGPDAVATVDDGRATSGNLRASEEERLGDRKDHLESKLSIVEDASVSGERDFASGKSVDYANDPQATAPDASALQGQGQSHGGFRSGSPSPQTPPAEDAAEFSQRIAPRGEGSAGSNDGLDREPFAGRPADGYFSRDNEQAGQDGGGAPATASGPRPTGAALGPAETAAAELRPGHRNDLPVNSPEPSDDVAPFADSAPIPEGKPLADFDVVTDDLARPVARKEDGQALGGERGRPAQSSDAPPAPAEPRQQNHESNQASGEKLDDASSKEPSERDLEDEKKGGVVTQNETRTKEHAKVKRLENGWRRSNKLPNTSRLMVGENEELPLEGMQVNVQVDGYRARVLLDLYYLNPHPQRLEGRFQLRLPNEASLYFFAFGETTYGPKGDQRQSVRQALFNLRGEKQLGTQPEEIMQARAETWKAPKEARMVTRVKAAYAYRETMRKQVDPALVEWAGAGIFAARVFPLMPQKLHRVVIGYDVNLLRLGDDLVYRLDLPDHVGECTVDLNVAAQAGKEAKIQPEVRPFTAAGRAYFHYERPEYRQFEVRMVEAGNTLIHGEDPDSGPFFAASFLPELPPGGDAAGAEQAVFLVDTSLSSNPEKFNVRLSLLKATLTNNRDTMREFAVLFFNIEQHWWQEKFVANTAENVDELTKYCHTLALEGATDLGGALRVAAAPAWQGATKDKLPARDYFLLSDGAITWGERDLHHLLKSAGLGGSVFAYRTGLAETDVETLTHLTRETGGAVFTVAGDAEVEAASKAHRQRPWQLLEVSVEGGSDLMLAGQPRTLFGGQQLLLVGRGTPADDAVISLKVKRGNERRTIDVAIDQRVQSDLAPRQYGHVATMGLEELGDATEDVSAAYARHFRITGQTCSLLMLESEADYRRFNIKPQDDAFVVKSTAATTVIASVFDRMAATLGDAKATFTAWMAKLEKTPGLSFEISPALKVAMDALPKSAFAVRVEPLSCNERTWEPIAEPLREMLSVRSFGYTDIMREAERRRTTAGAADALKALSSLVEHSPGDLVLARDVGFSALDWGLGDQAYHLLRRVAESRPYEPQTYLAIAHCLSGMDRADLAMLYYEIALGANWDSRFPDFKQIASVDYLHFLRQVKSGKLRADGSTFAAARLESLSREVDLKTCDLLMTIMWNTDGTDVDMHVVEPSGEECYYQHRTTRAGGQLTRDATQGYGPEMYILRKAPAGEYKIRAKYFASDRNRLSTRTRVIATVYENWGTPDERMERRTVTLDTGKQMTDIMTVKR